MTLAELIALRDSPNADQSRLGPLEHEAFAREWVKDNPLALFSLLAAIPGYSAAKGLGLVKGRSPASLEEMAGGYRGVWQGLGERFK